MKSLLARLGRVLRARRGKPKKVVRPPDARVDASPWLGQLLDVLGERYRLGPDVADGIQVLCRTARERFNPMRVYVQPTTKLIQGDYDVRLPEGQPVTLGHALLDKRVTSQLAQWGLTPQQDQVQEWGGTVLTRRYAGPCPEAEKAAAAVAFLCRGPESVMNVAAE